MNFVLRDVSRNSYFHNNGKIILFETEQEAQNFLNDFDNYISLEAFSMGIDPEQIDELRQNTAIENLPTELHCGVINFKDI